ncbi:hypothetical protein HIM_11255 [Hirsutella minnesotensis 3608]|uniref:Uncharacterized protein n=1 Tax=Hirsutella minnesotensis 3608 TaxID=1043627 RepID=A0A0F8A1E6_9HYPO|nr:hypothetical protein HIM_11255 [Hirsutella minnesotensis 3608]
MPWLSEVRYSRNACIAAIRDYYAFLAKMYVDESAIVEPPDGGWPGISVESMRDLDKSEEVITLLRHLPYIRYLDDKTRRVQGAADCYFVDWDWASRSGPRVLKKLRSSTEDDLFYDAVPPHVIGLTESEEDCAAFLLDTNIGVVYWYECPGDIRYNPSREPIRNEAHEYSRLRDAEWRAKCAAWAVADFFAMLKDRLCELHSVPINSRIVMSAAITAGPDADGMLPMLQHVYHEHGWPDLERYSKQGCLEAVQKTLKEHYPLYAEDLLEGDGTESVD